MNAWTRSTGASAGLKVGLRMRRRTLKNIDVAKQQKLSKNHPTRQQYRALSLVGQGHSLRSMVGRSELPPRLMLETLKPFLTGGMVEMA